MENGYEYLSFSILPFLLLFFLNYLPNQVEFACIQIVSEEVKNYIIFLNFRLSQLFYPDLTRHFGHFVQFGQAGYGRPESVQKLRGSRKKKI